MPEPTATRRTPALVISGFLGSGKTSLVRRLLDDAQAQGLRVAFVSNELGALGVDRALLGGGGEAFVELEGGCVCCELSDDLVETLQRLHDEVDPDRVVIETSGVALPFDTQLNFWREPVSHWIGDDMAVVVVNAEQIAEGRDLEGVFEDQVSSADLLILNKVDLVDESTLAALEEKLSEIEDEAPIVRAVHGDVETRLLFPPALLAGGATDRGSEAPEHAHEHHHDEFEASEMTIAAGIEPTELEHLLRARALLRAKGWVETSEGLRLVQLVGRRIELSVPEGPVAPEQIGRLVAIRRVE